MLLRHLTNVAFITQNNTKRINKVFERKKYTSHIFFHHNVPLGSPYE